MLASTDPVDGGIEHLPFNPYGNCNPPFLASANVVFPADSPLGTANPPRDSQTLPPKKNGNTQTLKEKHTIFSIQAPLYQESQQFPTVERITNFSTR